MSAESTAPDLVELTRRAIQAANRRDLDAVMNVYSPEAVYRATALGVDFEGVAAIRALYEDWMGAYDDWAVEIEEILDLGNGVGFAVVRQKGRPVGSTGYLGTREASVSLWVEGLCVRMTGYLDVDEARAAAERLADSRG